MRSALLPTAFGATSKVFIIHSHAISLPAPCCVMHALLLPGLDGVHFFLFLTLSAGSASNRRGEQKGGAAVQGPRWNHGRPSNTQKPGRLSLAVCDPLFINSLCVTPILLILLLLILLFLLFLIFFFCSVFIPFFKYFFHSSSFPTLFFSSAHTYIISHLL